MVALSRAALLSLAALCLHFSILSIILHISRHSGAPGKNYHASVAVALTELGKILVSIVLIFWTGELRPRMAEKNRSRNPRAKQGSPAWLDAAGGASAERDMVGGAGGLPDGNGANSEKGEGGASTSSKRRGTIENSQHARTSSLRINTSAPPQPSSQSESNRDARSSPDFVEEQSDSPVEMNALAMEMEALYPETHVQTDPSSEVPITSWKEDVQEWAAWVTLKEIVFGPGWWKLAIPSGLFVFQSNAQYLASGNLSVPTFQLAYQLKIPATALCAVILLKRSLSNQQWVSLGVLTLGVGIVQLYSSTPTGASVESIRANSGNAFLGICAVIAACLSSGFASTYFERMLKAPSNGVDQAPPPSLWIRNIQLSLFGILVGLPLVCYETRQSWILSAGLEGDWLLVGGGAAPTVFGTVFQGFNAMTCLVIVMQVSGGLLGALVMQYSDNVTKCYATSVSILISFAASVYLFDFHITFGVVLGAALVLLATWAYTQPSRF